MKKRIISLLLAIVMLVGMIPFGTVATAAEDVGAVQPYEYIGSDGNAVTLSDFTFVTAADTVWQNGNYAVSGKVDIPHTVTVSGNVNLILFDNAELTVTGDEYYAGIYLTSGNTLNIYGQSHGNGVLRATAGAYSAAIGGSGGDDEGVLSVVPDAGDVNIYSGIIYPTGDCGAAAIGGGWNGNSGNINICGGVVHPAVNEGNDWLAVCFGEGYKENAKTVTTGKVTFGGGAVRAVCDGGVARCKQVVVGDGINIYDLKNHCYDYNLRVNSQDNPITDALIGTLTYLKDGNTEYFDFTKFAIYEGETVLDEGSFYYVLDNYTLPSTLCTNDNTIVLADHVTLDARIGKNFDYKTNVYAQSVGAGHGIFMTERVYAADGTEKKAGNYTKYTGATAIDSGWYYVTENYNFDFPIKVSGDVRLILGDGVTFAANVMKCKDATLTVYTESIGENKGKLVGKTDTFLDYIPNGTAGAFEEKALPDGCFALDDRAIWGTAGTETWYFLTEDIEISERVSTLGNVHLVLGNGKTLNCPYGINVLKGNRLTVYAQTEDPDIMGTLNASGDYDCTVAAEFADPIAGGLPGYPAIGNAYGTDGGGSITINGGNIIAKGGNKCPAIGSTYDTTYPTGKGDLDIDICTHIQITLNGGKIDAVGGNKSCAIGAGYTGEAYVTSWYSSVADVIVNGGDITATGGSESVAIGTGRGYRSYAFVKINGGNITADSIDEKYPAIGGGTLRYDTCQVTRTCFADIYDAAAAVKNKNDTRFKPVYINEISKTQNIRIYASPKHKLDTAYNGTAPVTDEQGNITAHGCKPYYKCKCGLYFSDTDFENVIGTEEALALWKEGDGCCDTAEEIPYIDIENGVSAEKTIPETAVRYFNYRDTDIGEDGKDTWYYSAFDIRFSHQVVVHGNVHIILKDGATANFDLDLRVFDDNAVSIYAQSEGETAGTLTAKNVNHVSDNYIRNGNEPWYSAGIGPGRSTGSDGGIVVINGGNIIAHAGEGMGAAIGGVSGSAHPTAVVINGGNVKAYSDSQTAALGAGATYGKATLDINGGTTEAYSKEGNAIHTQATTVRINICKNSIFEGDNAESAVQNDKYTGKKYLKVTPCEAVHKYKTMFPLTSAKVGKSGEIIYGHRSYYQCYCGNYYEDEGCIVLIPDIDEWLAGDGKNAYDGIRYTWEGSTCHVELYSTVTPDKTEYTAAGTEVTVKDATCSADRVIKYRAEFSEAFFSETVYSEEFSVPGTALGHIDTDEDGFCDRCKLLYYIDENGNAKVADAYSTPSTSMNGGTNGRFYYVSTDTTFEGSVTVLGKVSIVLKNGVTLTAKSGITVNENNTLCIYAQSTGENVGSIVATGKKGYAGIGGDFDTANAGSIILGGGNIKATGGMGAAGIGGGFGGNGGTVVIGGGSVEAVGGAGSVALDLSRSAGIGGGWGSTSGGSITVCENIRQVKSTGYSAMGNGEAQSDEEQLISVTVADGLSIRAGESDENSARVKQADGERFVYIIPTMVGDLNVDAKVNALDLVEMKIELLGGAENERVLDANGDDAFDIRDLVRMKKHLADEKIPLGK